MCGARVESERWVGIRRRNKESKHISVVKNHRKNGLDCGWGSSFALQP